MADFMRGWNKCQLHTGPLILGELCLDCREQPHVHSMNHNKFMERVPEKHTNVAPVWTAPQAG